MEHSVTECGAGRAGACGVFCGRCARDASCAGACGVFCGRCARDAVRSGDADAADRKGQHSCGVSRGKGTRPPGH
eukprot:3161967-Prymnesium_polylepis.1